MMLTVSWAKTLSESPVNKKLNIISQKIRFRIPKKSDFEHSELSVVFVKLPTSHEYYNREYHNYEYYNPEYYSHEYYNLEY